MLLDNIRTMDLGEDFEYKKCQQYDRISYKGYKVVEIGYAVKKGKYWLDVIPQVFDSLTPQEVQAMEGVRDYDKHIWRLNCRLYINNLYDFIHVFELAVNWEKNNR